MHIMCHTNSYAPPPANKNNSRKITICHINAPHQPHATSWHTTAQEYGMEVLLLHHATHYNPDKICNTPTLPLCAPCKRRRVYILFVAYSHSLSQWASCRLAPPCYNILATWHCTMKLISIHHRGVDTNEPANQRRGEQEPTRIITNIHTSQCCTIECCKKASRGQARACRSCRNRNDSKW